jgi:hypothetical protein
LAVNGKVDLKKVVDPYLLYGGSYANDPKDSKDFKYLSFTECPKFTPAHKSFMAKFLTPEVRNMTSEYDIYSAFKEGERAFSFS